MKYAWYSRVMHEDLAMIKQRLEDRYDAEIYRDVPTSFTGPSEIEIAMVNGEEIPFTVVSEIGKKPDGPDDLVMVAEIKSGTPTKKIPADQVSFL